jgi:hypothetical protein
MPIPKKGEKKESYISRCIKEVMNEGGHTTEQAAGKCYGMWNEYHKSKADNIQEWVDSLFEKEENVIEKK